MAVLGIVGSPRKRGRTNRLIDAALDGAMSRGTNTEKIYLVDYDVKPITELNGSVEDYDYCPEELSRLCEEADAIILGAPVYWGDINGLTKDFMDTVRMDNSNGKPALGIVIAGGTGKGLLSGIQSIYHFFFHRQLRGIDPTPVSRFNLEAAVLQLGDTGSRLAEASKEKLPFSGVDREERWQEVSAHYASLKYLRCDHIDEFILLTEQLITASAEDNLDKSRDELDKALHLIDKGRREEAAIHAVNAYQTLYYPP